MLVIISFHMKGAPYVWELLQPLLFFFLLSGYVTKAGSFSYSKWWRRLVALAVPYFIWNTLCIPGVGDELSFGRIFGLGPEGRFCADYPLWYLRALFLLMLVYPFFRKVPWLPALAALAFMCWGDSWHCALEKMVPLPSPSTTFAFFTGCTLSVLSADSLRRVLQLIGLPLLILLVGHQMFPFLPAWIGMSAGMFCIPAIIVWLSLLPGVCHRLAVWSNATFLAFATHAGFIVLVQRGIPSVAFTYWAQFVFPPVFFAAAYAMLLAMERWCPAPLPYIAHRGRLPWLRG